MLPAIEAPTHCSGPQRERGMQIQRSGGRSFSEPHFCKNGLKSGIREIPGTVKEGCQDRVKVARIGAVQEHALIRCQRFLTGGRGPRVRVSHDLLECELGGVCVRSVGERGEGLPRVPLKHNLEHYWALEAMFVAVVNLKLTEGTVEAFDGVRSEAAAGLFNYCRQGCPLGGAAV